MIVALSPVVSWALFLACVAVGVTVYVVVAGGHRYRRIERQVAEWRRGLDVLPCVEVRPEDAPPSGGLPPAGPPLVRILGVYDHEARGDFDR